MKSFLKQSCPARQQTIRVICWLALLLVSLAPLQAAPRGRLQGNPLDMPYNPQPDYWREFAGLKLTTDRLLNSIGTTNAEAATLSRQIQTNAQFLHDKWDRWFHTHDQSKNYSRSDGYLTALRGDNRQLDKMQKEKDAEKILAAVRDVALDVQIKADNCRSSSDGLGKEIKVKVRTKAGGKEQGGYQIFVVSKGMFDVKSAHDRFPKLSSPTDEKILPPGNYAFWVRKNNFAGEPAFLGVGGHGETQVAVDLEVPAE